MPKHIVRLLLILGVAAVAAVTAKAYFTAPSFGLYGHYRAASVPEIAAQKPRFMGPEYCRQCHVERVAFWGEGKHATVKCEICHGPAEGHPAISKLRIPIQTVQLCGSCHASMPARPGTVRQVVISEHMGDQACIECHNPHSPTNFRWDDIQGLIDQFRSDGENHG